MEQEGRITLAITAYKNGQIPSINKAAALFNVPRLTLHYYCIKGRAVKLTLNEQESLIKWILDLYKRRRPPWHAYVQNMANYLAMRENSSPSP